MSSPLRHVQCRKSLSCQDSLNMSGSLVVSPGCISLWDSCTSRWATLLTGSSALSASLARQPSESKGPFLTRDVPSV